MGIDRRHFSSNTNNLKKTHSAPEQLKFLFVAVQKNNIWDKYNPPKIGPLVTVA